MPIPKPHQNLNDADLAKECLLHNRAAWEEFFLRFSPLMKMAIRRTFIKSGVKELAEDFDNIADIHAELVGKLYGKGILRKCKDLDGLRPWLVRVSINQTLEWLVHRGRIKRLPAIQEEQFMRRLSAPLTEDGELTLQDLLEDAGADLFLQLEQSACQQFAECLLDQLLEIKNLTLRWTLRLSILGQLSLSDEELYQLQTLSPLSDDVVEEKVSTLEESLFVKEKERQDILGKAVLAWHQQRIIEAKITRLTKENQADNAAEIAVLNAELASLDVLKAKHLAACAEFPSPSNWEIAELIGIPLEKKENVSQYLIRARKTLRRKLELKSS